MTETNLLGSAPRRVLSERELCQVFRRLHGRCDGDAAAHRPQRDSRRTHPCPTMSEQEQGTAQVDARGATHERGGPESLLVAGEPVRLTGLSRTELNSQEAQVLFYHPPSGRWAVKLDAGAELRVRAQNLLVAFPREAYEEGARPALWPDGPPTWCRAAETLSVGWEAAEGEPALLSFTCPHHVELHEMVWAFLSPQLEHVNEFEHDWSLDDEQLRGARYTLKLRRGSATAAEAEGAQLAELSPYFALLRALRQATARAAHWWTITAEPALCVVPCEITPARVRRAMPIFYGNPRVGSLGQPSPEGDWGEVASMPVPHTRGRWAGQPSSVTFGSFAAATNTDVASALVNWAASSVFELQAEVDFALDRGKRGRTCERTCDMRRESRAARTMPDSLLAAKLAAMAKLVQRTLEPWGVLVRLDGGAEAGEEAGRVTDY